MAQFVEMLVIIPLFFTIPLWRNDHVHLLSQSLLNDHITVITSVRKQPLGGKTINQGTSLFTIMDGSSCYHYANRHAIRVNGKMYFRIQPPFVTPISWLPPTAPAA